MCTVNTRETVKRSFENKSLLFVMWKWRGGRNELKIKCISDERRIESTRIFGNVFVQPETTITRYRHSVKYACDALIVLVYADYQLKKSLTFCLSRARNSTALFAYT